MPPNDEDNVAENDMDKIMLISLPISEETILMESDSSDSFGRSTKIGSNITISINTNSVEEVTRIYASL